MSNKKQKILIVEHVIHYKIIGHLSYLFSQKYDVSILLKRKFEQYVNVSKDSKFINFRIPHFLIFFLLIFKASRFDYIFISSGTEYKKGVMGFFFSLGLLLLIRCFPDKVIFNLRNLAPYFSQKKESINHKLRKKIIRSSKRITFESESMKVVFSGQYKNINKLLSSIYVYYNLAKPPYFISEKIINIGVLGNINLKKRDYLILKNTLLRLQKEKNISIKLIFLGKANNESSIYINDNFKNLAEVWISTQYISDLKIEQLGSQCQFLIAPLIANNEMGTYGTNKGTGAFGDAIALNKRLIIPQFSDPRNEFADFCSYYSNETELYNNIVKLSDKKSNFDLSVFNKFSIKTVFLQVEKELKL